LPDLVQLGLLRRPAQNAQALLCPDAERCSASLSWIEIQIVDTYEANALCGRLVPIEPDSTGLLIAELPSHSLRSPRAVVCAVGLRRLATTSSPNHFDL